MQTAASTTNEQQSRVIGRPFPKGVSGNPKGRTIGARNKLQTNFLEALAADFAQHGPQSIAELRGSDPGKYLQIVASLCPKELHINHSPLDDLSDAELFAAVDALRSWLVTQQDAGGDSGATGEGQGSNEPAGVH